MIQPSMTMFRLTTRGGLGLACDQKGVSLGPVALIDALLSNGKCVYRPRPPEEIARTLALAYGPFSADDLARRLSGLEVAARALEAGDLAKAGIATVLLQLPPLTAEASAKLTAEPTLRKYSPDQPRDERGRWTSEDAVPTQAAANRADAADAQVAQIPSSFFARPPGIVRPPILRPPLVRPPLEQYPTEAAKPPGPGWEWNGKNPTPGSREGNWYNPKTKESLHPDPDHAPPTEPHWDYKAPDGQWYRWFPDGRMEPKSMIPVLPAAPSPANPDDIA